MRSIIPMMFVSLLMAVAAGCDRAGHAASEDGGGPTGHAHGDSHEDGNGHEDGGGHGHGDDGGGEPVCVTRFTSKVQLFMEYPHLAKGEQASFLAHLTVLATGEPVRSGSLTFEATPSQGEPVLLTMDAPRRDGLFVPEWKPVAPGVYRLRLTVTSPQVRETIDVGRLIVHPDADAAFHAAEASAEDDPPDLVPFLLEQQWKIGVRYEKADKRTLVRRLAIPARITAPQGASASVSPPVAGRLLSPPDGRLPRIGDQVKAGEILALIEPQLSASQIFELSANRAEIQSLDIELALRELDLDTKALEVDRSIIQAEARFDFARRVMQRASQLREKGVGTDQQYDEAEQGVRLAKAEHEAAQAMKRSYEGARTRLAGLRARALPDGGATRPANVASQMPLVAPITGEIVVVAHIEGEHLGEAHQEIFRIVNTDRIWIEADISEFDLHELAENPGATMILPAYPGRRFDILDSDRGRLVNIGSIVDPKTRTLSIVYEMLNPEGLFRVGMFANVHLETRTASDVVALPEKAVVLDNGQPMAYVLIDGENFQRRALVLGIRDRGFVEVKSGVTQGERVVTQGAYAIKLASLAPASFGHGHGH